MPKTINITDASQQVLFTATVDVHSLGQRFILREIEHITEPMDFIQLTVEDTQTSTRWRLYNNQLLGGFLFGCNLKLQQMVILQGELAQLCSLMCNSDNTITLF